MLTHSEQLFSRFYIERIFRTLNRVICPCAMCFCKEESRKDEGKGEKTRAIRMGQLIVLEVIPSFLGLMGRWLRMADESLGFGCSW